MISVSDRNYMKPKRWHYTFVCFAVLVSLRFFSFSAVPDAVNSALEIGVTFFLIILILLQSAKLKRLPLPFIKNVRYMILIPLILGSTGALFFHDQGLVASFWRQRTLFIWLLYPVLHLFNIPSKKIIKLIVVCGCVWAFLTIIQQFTYPFYLFYEQSDADGTSIFRAGVYRFRILIFHYCIFMTFYFFNEFLVSRKTLTAAMILFSMMGMYYLGTRQFAVGVVACLITYSVLQRGKLRFMAIIVIGLTAVGLFAFKDVLFGDYIEMTNDQLSSDDDIRLVSYDYFLFKNWPGWGAYLIGNGVASASSEYGQKVLNMANNFRVYASDVGIVGSFNTYGIFYVINLLILIGKVLLTKFQSPEDNYLKLPFFNALLLFILTDYFLVPSVIPFWCLVLYLIDKARVTKSNRNEVIN